MALAAAVPLCGWFLAACVSSSVAWKLQDTEEPPVSKLGKGKRRAMYARKLSAGFSSVRPTVNNVRGRDSRNGISSCREGSGFSGGLESSWFGSTNLKNSVTGDSLCGSGGFSPISFKSRSLDVKRNNAGKTMAVATEPVRETTEKKVLAVKQRRVVITGMGVVSCIGHDPTTFYDNLLSGKSGITPIENFNASDFSTRIAGEIKEFSVNGYVNPKMAKRMDKFMWYMLTAGKRALEDAGMTSTVLSNLDKKKCGILIGSAMGGMQVFSDALEALTISYRKMNPFCIPFATTNMGSAMLAMDLGWMGPNYSISTACATGNYCILSAANHIIRGDADVMLSGGSDAAILPVGLGGFVACRALSKRNDEPERASRPWDKGRDGFVMGEGAGVLVMEELEHAKSRGATIYAEFLGGSLTCDAYHMTEPHPDGRGVNLCIEKALKSTGVKREDVNYVNAHATSTQAGDLQEYKAIVKSFGENKELKINATKSMIGHLLGAAGAVEAVATIQAIRTGYVHPNLNVDDPEDLVNTNFIVGNKKEKFDIKVALSNSFGFGGHNSSILFAPFSEEGVKKD